MNSIPVQVTVNGRARSCSIDPRTTLADLLRDGLGLTGTHVGCKTGSCGACTVDWDGRTVKSCCVLGAEVDGSSVRTVEGLTSPDGTLHPVQEAFAECHALQCGFCTPGMVMSATALLESNAQPTEDDIRGALKGNLCRCTGYTNIMQAVQVAAAGGHQTASSTGEMPDLPAVEVANPGANDSPALAPVPEGVALQR